MTAAVVVSAAALVAGFIYAMVYGPAWRRAVALVVAAFFALAWVRKAIGSPMGDGLGGGELAFGMVAMLVVCAASLKYIPRQAFPAVAMAGAAATLVLMVTL